ncbi:MAG: exopolyphosphatase [Clostridiales bacterium]|nr:exopolyphosphatase [Clostridiales bacterium]
MIRTFAAINVGAFELALGIYEISDRNRIRSIDFIKHMIALGSDTYYNGKISYRLVEELCDVLEDFARIMKGYKVNDYRAYATSALREARNSQIVIEQVRVRTGIEIRVISNSEQRFLNYKAVAARDEEFANVIQQGTAIVDMGFGSLQVSLFDKDSIVATQNLPLGAVPLKEMLTKARVSVETERAIAQEMVDNELVTFRKMYLKDRNIKTLIAIGEPVMLLYAKTEAGKQRTPLSMEELGRVFERIRSMTRDQIEDAFDVNAGYAAMLMPTAVIIRRLLEITGAETIWAPGTHLVDGIAAEYAEDKKLLKLSHDFSNDIIVASRNMAKRYKCYMPHVQAVEAAALKIFDALKKYHGMKARERLLLQIAVNLHSCGKFVTMRNGNDCAYHIIMSTEIIGLSHLEREIVANVVKYHEQKFQYDEVEISTNPTHDSLRQSEESVILRIAKLTAILRLANSMDRSHMHKLEDARLSIKDSQLVITTGYPDDLTLEALSIAEKGDFFEEIFGVRPVLKQKKRG